MFSKEERDARRRAHERAAEWQRNLHPMLGMTIGGFLRVSKTRQFEREELAALKRKKRPSP